VLDAHFPVRTLAAPVSAAVKVFPALPIRSAQHRAVYAVGRAVFRSFRVAANGVTAPALAIGEAGHKVHLLEAANSVTAVATVLGAENSNLGVGLKSRFVAGTDAIAAWFEAILGAVFLLERAYQIAHAVATDCTIYGAGFDGLGAAIAEPVSAIPLAVICFTVLVISSQFVKRTDPVVALKAVKRAVVRGCRDTAGFGPFALSVATCGFAILAAGVHLLLPFSALSVSASAAIEGARHRVFRRRPHVTDAVAAGLALPAILLTAVAVLPLLLRAYPVSAFGAVVGTVVDVFLRVETRFFAHAVAALRLTQAAVFRAAFAVLPVTYPIAARVSDLFRLCVGDIGRQIGESGFVYRHIFHSQFDSVDYVCGYRPVRGGVGLPGVLLDLGVGEGPEPLGDATDGQETGKQQPGSRVRARGSIDHALLPANDLDATLRGINRQGCFTCTRGRELRIIPAAQSPER